jgi:hypothetical protein
MKKAILISFICGIAMMFSSFAMALDAPIWNVPCASLGDESVCFDWGGPDPEIIGVKDAVKYSVDIVVHEVEVENSDGVIEKIAVEFSFGTSDRTDGLSMETPSLCVPLTDLQYDTNGDGVLDSIHGKVTVKVKALAPGKGKGRQNHPFSSDLCTFELTEKVE